MKFSYITYGQGLYINMAKQEDLKRPEFQAHVCIWVRVTIDFEKEICYQTEENPKWVGCRFGLFPFLPVRFKF